MRAASLASVITQVIASTFLIQLRRRSKGFPDGSVSVATRE
jgi:hypothetical protein